METIVERLGSRHDQYDAAGCVDGTTNSSAEPVAVLSWPYSNLVRHPLFHLKPWLILDLVRTFILCDQRTASLLSQHIIIGFLSAA